MEFKCGKDNKFPEEDVVMWGFEDVRMWGFVDVVGFGWNSEGWYGGRVEWRSDGRMEWGSDGMMEWGNIGILEGWNIGMEKQGLERLLRVKPSQRPQGHEAGGRRPRSGQRAVEKACRVNKLSRGAVKENKGFRASLRVKP